jgi:hypothetical protein
MTKDDIIRMAREAGFADGVAEIVGLAGFANFAALVAATEREACAKLCDSHVRYPSRLHFAAVIRARGTT